jgi:hypothetical protein
MPTIQTKSKFTIRLINLPKADLEYDNKTINDYIAGIPEETVKNYKYYWNTITPKDHDEYYKRWIFAFLSVHCGWKANIKGYVNIIQQEDKKIASPQTLRDIITISGVGLITMRTKGMWKFKEDFYKDPQWWYKKADENWDLFRYRTMNKCHGLGYAKTAFAIELCYPNECEVTCLDTHALQLYDYKKKSTPSPVQYRTFEQHWINTCKARDIPPFQARNIYWNKIQAQPDCRYWTYVFEDKKMCSNDAIKLVEPLENKNIFKNS